MRIVVVKQDTDLQALKAAVATPGLAEKLARLNPHLDVQKLVPGAVLLLPDDAAGRDRGPAGSTSIAGNALSSFNDFAAEALEAATEKMQWAFRKDTGHHIAPLTVAAKPASMGA